MNQILLGLLSFIVGLIIGIISTLYMLQHANETDEEKRDRNKLKEEKN